MEFLKGVTPDINSDIRILHAIPNAPNVDVYANGTLIAKNLSFGSVSNYQTLPPDTYEFQLYRAGFYDTPLATQKVQLSPSANYTISVVTLSGNIFLFKLKDAALATSPNTSYLRFINLSKNAPLLSLELSNGTPLFSNVEYLETTGYYVTSPGIYNFRVAIAGSSTLYKNIRSLSLDDGKFNTVYILGLFNGEPQLGSLILDDIK